MSKTRGFTLLEILIALTIFAILATLTSTALYNAFNTRERVNQQANQLNILSLALSLFENDTQNVLNRSISGNEMHAYPPFIGEAEYVEFTRGGMTNPLAQQQRSSLQRVAYRCQDNQLIRRSWLVLDSLEHNRQYQDKILLSGLTACHFGYVGRDKQFLSAWQAYALQQNQHQATLPMAIQLSLVLNNWGEISLLFLIPEGLYAETI